MIVTPATDTELAERLRKDFGIPSQLPAPITFTPERAAELAAMKPATRCHCIVWDAEADFHRNHKVVGVAGSLTGIPQIRAWEKYGHLYRHAAEVAYRDAVERLSQLERAA